MSLNPGVELTSESIKKLVDKEWLGLKTIDHVKDEPGVREGENYASVMRRLFLTGQDNNGATVTKRIVVKKNKIRPKDTVLPVFEREIMMYTEILPKMKEIVKEANAKGIKIKLEATWPDCCGVRRYDAIFLEDLKESGYDLRNRREPMSPEIAIYIAGELGKFHGVSINAINRKMIDPNKINTNIYALNLPLINSIWDGGLTLLADYLETEEEWKFAVPKLRYIAKNAGEELVKMNERIKGLFPVVCHGDCWSSNILFKFSEDSKPYTLRFVDYQASQYNTFAWDLIYLMHTSMQASDREGCYDTLVKHYRMNLIATLEALEEDTSQVPDVNRMKEIMDECGLFSLLAAFAYFPITINTMKKAWETDKAFENSENPFKSEMIKNEIFMNSVKKDLIKFKRLGLL